MAPYRGVHTGIHVIMFVCGEVGRGGGSVGVLNSAHMRVVDGCTYACTSLGMYVGNTRTALCVCRYVGFEGM